MALDSFLALKLLWERLKQDFDDTRLFFFTYKKVLGFSFQHVIPLI